VPGRMPTMLHVSESFSFFCPEIRERNRFKSHCSAPCTPFSKHETFTFSHIDDTKK